MIPTADRERLIQTLESKAWRYRIDIVEMITEAGSGHPGGSLSVIDIVSCLYHYKLRHRPADPGTSGGNHRQDRERQGGFFLREQGGISRGRPFGG